MNDLESFAVLVRKLREAQKNFFRTREHSYLFESKALEKIVDKKISEILDDKQLEL